MNIEQVGQGTFVFVEQMFVKLRARDDFAAMQREEFHQRVFACGEFGNFILEKNVPRGGVNLHVADFNDVRGFVRAAADESSQAGAQLRPIKRLDDIIVRPGVEAASVARRLPSRASRVRSWQFTPGTSSIQPIHHPSSCLMTAVY